MKLDSRIKALSDILTCFDTERAKEFIGQKGYFSDYLYVFTDLSDRAAGFLTAIRDQDYAFHQDEDGGYFRFFLPESSLKPAEKKFRPYTLEEFEDKFPVGRPIKFRVKAVPRPELFLFQNDTSRNTQIANVYVYVSTFQYDFDWLFEECELYDDSTRAWKPFGVEE